MLEILKKYIDWTTIAIGCICMIFMLLYPDSNINKILIYTIGIAGLLYIIYAAHLWIIKRADFDYHLINGHFLRKVICLVVSTPFTLTMFIGIDTPISRELGFYNNQNDTIAEQQIKTTYTAEQCCTENSTHTNIASSHPADTMNRTNTSVFWSVYYHFMDPGNQHTATTPRGRTLTAIICLLGVFLLNGLLVSSIIGWIDRRKEKWINGSICYKSIKHLGKNKFAVVIGANDITASVIKNLLTPPKSGDINYKCEGQNDYILLQTSRNPEDVRTELASHLGENDLKRIIIYKALRDSIEELKKLHIEYSTEIYILGESVSVDGNESCHDALNMRCINLIVKELKQKEDLLKEERRKNGKSIRKVCKVLFEYQTTSSIFLFSDVANDINKHLIFIPFNRYESWARAVIADNTATEDCNEEKLNYTPLDGDNGISEDSDTHVHFVIAGMSNIGVAMGLQAMLQAHYTNFAKAEMEKDATKRAMQKKIRRTRITFIDTNADREMAFFKGRYENLFNLTRNRYIDANKCNKKNLIADSDYRWNDPMEKENSNWAHLSDDGTNFIDIEIEFIKGNLESEGIRTYLHNISDTNNTWAKNSKLTIAICLTQIHRAVAASLYMPITVYEKAQEIWVYQKESADIILNLTKTEQRDKRYKKLKPFGMLHSKYINDRSRYLKALLVNGAYDLNGKINGKEIKAEDRNMSQKETYSDLRESWKKLSIDKKFSNKYFVDSIPQKIRSINANGLSSEELAKAIKEHTSTLARSEHNRWNIQQLLLGYSPCNKNIDDEFTTLNTNLNTANKIVEQWKQTTNFKNLPKKEQEKLKATIPCFINFENAKNIFKKTKESYKEGEDRLHPNICAYNHLDKVDSGAKSYDETLNSIIPVIKQLVDDKLRRVSPDY